MTRYPRAALARLTVCACAYALACVIAGSAMAQPLRSDDGGRAARFAASLFMTGSRGASDVAAQALRYVGAGKFTGLPGAWCADAASRWLVAAGLRPLPNRMAASALAYGPHVADPRRGDLVVLSTRAGYAHHVGVFLRWTPGGVEIVSGNWSHRVAIAVVSRRAINAFIRV